MWTVQNEFLPTTAGSVCYQCKMPLRQESPTGQPGHEKALDTGQMIDFEGALAFCESCIVEAAALLGMVTPQRAAELEALVAWAEAHQEEAERSAAQAQADRADVLRAFALLPNPTFPAIDVEERVAERGAEQLTPVKRGPGRPRKQ